MSKGVYRSGRIAQMRRRYGKDDDHTCRECGFYQTAYSYCLLYGARGRHPWSADWLACGKWWGRSEVVILNNTKDET